MPDPLSDLLPWEASEVRYNARELFLEYLWDSQEEFDLTMQCRGTEDLVNPKLFAALVAVDRDPQASLTFLRAAKRALEEFASSVLPDHFIEQAKNEYLNEAETNRKWIGDEVR